MGNVCTQELGRESTLDLQLESSKAPAEEVVENVEAVVAEALPNQESQHSAAETVAEAVPSIETSLQASADQDTGASAVAGTTGSSDFSVSIRRIARAKLGLKFELTEREHVHIVTFITPGSPFDEWNTANPSQAVQIDDRLVRVAGAADLLIQRIANITGQLELAFRRPASVTLSFEKHGNPLGAVLVAGNKALLVMGMTEGSMFARSASQAGIKVGDRIISVNGQRSESLTMLQSIQETDSLELRIMSY